MHRYDVAERQEPAMFRANVTTWSANFAGDLATASFPEAGANSQVLLNWLRAISRYGVATMEDIPIRSQSVLEVVELFGYPKRTQMGDWFEIKAQAKPMNLASSALGLQAHTDNP